MKLLDTKYFSTTIYKYLRTSNIQEGEKLIFLPPVNQIVTISLGELWHNYLKISVL